MLLGAVEVRQRHRVSANVLFNSLRVMGNRSFQPMKTSGCFPNTNIASDDRTPLPGAASNLSGEKIRYGGSTIRLSAASVVNKREWFDQSFRFQFVVNRHSTSLLLDRG
eukprot:CAMPEP_0202825688 /NCGR_PEP_ID=MMETSP1389-20130828/13173_1 /ASSEMBLY_ACC=CAM_ASM_000865 /TAXON_ID=302021 /ORGANISM="Rhodomonas sp., Strain CCMP768" /LENGTH=108 /DNA_ID=CAMNT_0049498933 /DNA_START=639 /DNA_END=961 /DNA_ORIENTATION=+